MPATALPTIEITPSVALEPTQDATDTPVIDLTGTPDSDPTGTPAIDLTGTPDTDTTGTPDTDTTGTPDTDTTGTPAIDLTGTPDTDTTGTPATDMTTTPVGSAGDMAQVSIEELLDNPEAYVEQQIMVASTVQEIYDPLGMQLSDETTPTAGSATMLMVVGEERLFMNTTDWQDAEVEVVGTVYAFDEAEFEREWDWFDANAAWVAEVEEGQPVLVADMITPAS